MTEQELVTPPGYEKQVWTYTGRRTTADGRVVFRVNDPEGEFTYKTMPIPGAVVGGQYRISIKEKSFITKGPNAPFYLGQDRDNPDWAKWWAADRAAGVHQDAKKQEAKAKKEKPIGNMTLNEAHDWLSSSIFGQYDARMAVIMGHLFRGKGSTRR